MTRKRRPAERKDRPKSMQQAVLQAVSKLGECSVSQVTSEVGWMIDASRAWREYHRRAEYEALRGRQCCVDCTPDWKVSRARRWVVGMTLSALFRDKRIIRVRRGVYAPVPIRIHVPDVG